MTIGKRVELYVVYKTLGRFFFLPIVFCPAYPRFIDFLA